MTRYTPTGEVIRGGLGTVVFCRDENLAREVAIKYAQGSADDRLHDEINALLRVRSKHVVEVFDIIKDPQLGIGIVQERVSGQDLTNILGKLAADDDGFNRLLYQIASGIADLHEVGVIHRDLKPENIRIDAEGIVKLIDFNLSRDIDDAHTRGFRGTFGYAAPELYVDEMVEFDDSVDVYAFGVLVVAVLRGSRLPRELKMKPPRPSLWTANTGGMPALLKGADPTLVTLLSECIHADQERRPKISLIRDRLGRLLCRGGHRALLTSDAPQVFELNAGNPRVRVSNNLGRVVIKYDGLDFIVEAIDGEVWINNMVLREGVVMPECCVIALGGPQRRASERTFVTMDVSHPEVVI